jgi:hypothetical protein
MPTTIPTGISFGDPPSVSGQNVTVSRLLQQPLVIERRLGEAIQPQYWMGDVFQSAGSAPSGAVIVEEWTPDLVALSRLEEELTEDVEVPLAGIDVGDIKTLEATEHGIGYILTDKHIRRNNRWIMDRRERALAFTLADGQNRRGLAALNLAISAHSRTFAAPDWSSVVPDGSTPSRRDIWPHSTIALVLAEQKADRIPFGYDTMIAHPLEVWRLRVLYGGPTGSPLTLQQLAAAIGIGQIIEDTTGTVVHGEPILVASTGIGGYVEEDPTTVEVIPERRRKRTVVQASGAGLYFVDNPYGVLKLVGTAVEDVTP